MRAIQFRSEDGERHVGLIEADGEHARTLVGVSTMYETAMRALRERQSLPALIARLATGPVVDYGRLLKEGKVLQPLDHPEPARFLITGTGVTHIGSADARNKMHVAAKGANAPSRIR